MKTGAPPPLMKPSPAAPQPPAAESADEKEARMRAAAKEFEAVFLSQMLKQAGFDDAFGSEIGPYSSFMLDEMAGRLADTGGFGLAEKVYEQLRMREGGQE